MKKLLAAAALTVLSTQAFAFSEGALGFFNVASGEQLSIESFDGIRGMSCEQLSILAESSINAELNGEYRIFLADRWYSEEYVSYSWDIVDRYGNLTGDIVVLVCDP